MRGWHWGFEMEQIEIINRVKATQNSVFWTVTWLAFYYILSSKIENQFKLFLSLFIFVLSYVLSSFYMVKLGGYVGIDLTSRISNIYENHKTTINRIFKIIGITIFIFLLILGGWYLFHLPNNYMGERVFYATITIIAGVTSGLIILYFQRKNGPK